MQDRIHPFGTPAGAQATNGGLQVQIINKAEPSRRAFGQALRGLGSRSAAPRSYRTPGRCSRNYAAPFGEAGFTRIDFLAIADQRNNDRPAIMPRHDFKRMGGFAHGQMAFTALAIACCLRLIPGALCFVENDDARFGRFMRKHHVMFQKAMHILQRGARGAFRCQKGCAALGCRITRQGFT